MYSVPRSSYCSILQAYCVACVNQWVKVKVSEMSPVIPCLSPGCKKELDVQTDLIVRLARRQKSYDAARRNTSTRSF